MNSGAGPGCETGRVFSAITPDSLGPMSEKDRLIEIETIISRFRWFVAPVAVLFTIFDNQQRATVGWVSCTAFIASCVIVTIALQQELTLPRIRLLGGFVILVDLAVITVAMLGDLGTMERGMSLALVLVIFEGAVRWRIVGGLLAGLGAVGSLAIWSAARADHLGGPVNWSGFLFRSLALVISGVALGAIMLALDTSRQAFGRQVRDMEVISRFAAEAPRRGEDDAVALLANLLHHDLGFDRAVILFHEPMVGILRPVAFSGYPEALTAPGSDAARIAEEGVPVDGQETIVNVCFREGVPQIVRDRQKLGGGRPILDPLIRSQLAVPLRAGTRRLGVLVVGSPEVDAFGPFNVRLLETVAGELAQVLENARLGEVQRRTIDELQRLSAMKDDFIAVTSHELRTPLTALKGFAGALDGRRSALSEEQIDRAVQAISRQVTRLNSLVEDLLAASLIDSGRSLPTPDEISLRALLSDVVHEVDPGGGRFAFRVDVPTDLDLIWADPSFLRRILVNLLANAVRYSPDGGTVEVAVRRSGTLVSIEVCDEGVGIAPDDLTRLFGKFVRLRADHSRGGTGLGLYIVKGLVEAMEGEVRVHSELGQGSCFMVLLPGRTDGERVDGEPVEAADAAVPEAVADRFPPGARPPAGAPAPRPS